MTRLTLRQFRAEAVVGLGLLLVVAVVLAVTGPQLVHDYASCRAGRGSLAYCNSQVLARYRPLQVALPVLVVAAPVLVGIFFGAPLIARELETGTFRLAWAQSVTRRRWLWVKLGVVGLASMALCGALTWMVNWWADPIDTASPDRFSVGNFGFHGVVPVGYAALAFALGATAGVVLRRTLPAIAVTLVGFVAARLIVTFWARRNFAPAMWGDARGLLHEMPPAGPGPQRRPGDGGATTFVTCRYGARRWPQVERAPAAACPDDVLAGAPAYLDLAG